MKTRKEFLPFGRPWYGQEEVAAVARVLNSGWSGPGPEVELFEKELAAYLGVAEVVCVASCSQALMLSTRYGEQRGYAVPALTWCSTADASPNHSLLDVERHTMSLAPITAFDKSVINVAYGGLVGGQSYILDAAHALSPRAAQSAYFACYSFYGNKNLAIGEGGAISTDDSEAAQWFRRMRQQGFGRNAWQRYNTRESAFETAKFRHGIKATMSDVQAAIGRAQLKKLRNMQQRRWEIANYYCHELPGIDPDIRWQKDLGTDRHAHHLFVVVLPIEKLVYKRDWLLTTMRDRGIGAAVHYVPLYKLGYGNTNYQLYPNTEWLYERILTLPISASMSMGDAADVVEIFGEVYEEAAKEKAQ